MEACGRGVYGAITQHCIQRSKSRKHPEKSLGLPYFYTLDTAADNAQMSCPAGPGGPFSARLWLRRKLLTSLLSKWLHVH